MSKYLYFRSDKFKSNRDFASWLHHELQASGENIGTPIDSDYMFVIPVSRDGQTIEIYLGKNDENCAPPLWQAWPEHKLSFFKKLFSKPSSDLESHFRKILGSAVAKIEGVSHIEWSDI